METNSNTRSRRANLVVPAAFALLMLAAVGCQILGDEQRRSPEVLRTGQMLSDMFCADCHEPADPELHTDAQWVSIVRDMGRRAQLTPLESEKLLAWMQWANDHPEDRRDAELDLLPTGATEPEETENAP